MVDDLINLINVTVCEENISGLGTGGFNMVDAILFLFGSCEFVLFDKPRFVILDGASANKSGLAAAIHYKTVNVIAGLVFVKQNFAAYKRIQVFFCFLVNFFTMNIDGFGQVDFAFSDM